MTDPIRLEIVFRPGMEPFLRQDIEDALQDALEDEGLGEVIGGGTAVDLSFSDIAIDLFQRAPGIEVVLFVLRQEQVPETSEVIEHGDSDSVHPVYDSHSPYVEPEVAVESQPQAPGPRAADLPQVGHTYLVPLPNGIYGACRVLAIRNDHYATLISGTEWFGEEPPPLTEPRLRSLLVHTCIGAVGPSCNYWMAGKPPEAFQYLGKLKPLPEEREITYGQYTDNWSFLVDGLSMQWEWLQKQK